MDDYKYDDEERELLIDFSRVKQLKSEILAAEKMIKDRINNLMNDRGVEVLTTPEFVCKRDVRSTEYVKKDLVPEDIWDEYALVTVYRVLQLKCQSI